MKNLKIQTSPQSDGTLKIEIPDLNLVTFGRGGDDNLDAVVEMCFSYCLQLETAGLNLHKELETLQ